MLKAFHENSQRHSLEQEIAPALILKSHGKSANQVLENWIVDLPMAPNVSTATGWKMKRRPNSAYFAIFLTSAASATDPAASAERIRFEDANVLTHVASQMRQRPRKQGYIVIPSGRFPSPRSRPDGSSMDGIPAAERPRRTTSLRAEWRGMGPALKRHDKGCVSHASIVVPHLYQRGMQTVSPTRRTTPIRRVSLSMKVPILLFGTQLGQTPDSGREAAL